MAIVRQEESFEFEGLMARVTLENYLERAVTLMEMTSDWVTDNQRNEMTRFFINVGGKFWGRASGVWSGYCNDEGQFVKATSLARYVHELDPEVILQSAIYEIIDMTVNVVPIPVWVFEEFDQKVESRNFNYRLMIFPDGAGVDFWGTNSSIPDITRLEMQMWVYYRARRYIDCGFEALHLGQTALTGRKDAHYAAWEQVMTRIRNYAYTNARRHNVLLDAHNNGMGYNGNLMLDFISFPSRPCEVVNRPCEAVLRSDGYLDSVIGKSIGGIHPQGWFCARSPYLIELDNWSGIDGIPGEPTPNGIGVWGYDEIAWFAHQPSSYRQTWLRYACNYLTENDINGHFEMPGFRTLGKAGGSLLFSGFKSDPLEAKIADVCSMNASNTELQLETGQPISEKPVIKYSGHIETLGVSACVIWKVFEVKIPVTSSTMLSYNLFPCQENGRYAYVGLGFSDGTALRDIQENSWLPTVGAVGRWTMITSNVGRWAPDKTIDRLLVEYHGVPSLKGTFSGLIGAIKIYEQGFYNAAVRSTIFPTAYEDELAIKTIWQDLREMRRALI